MSVFSPECLGLGRRRRADLMQTSVTSGRGMMKGWVVPEMAIQSPRGWGQNHYSTFYKPLQGKKRSGMPLAEVSHVSVKHG